MNLHLAWLLWARGGDVAAVVCCLLAFWIGGPVERRGAAIIGISWLLSFFLTQHAGHGPGPYIVIIDIVVLLAFAVLAVRSRRPWVFFATASQLNAVVAHFISNIGRFGIYGYVTAVGFWGGWALLLCLAAGIIGYRRQQAAVRHKAEHAPA